MGSTVTCGHQAGLAWLLVPLSCWLASPRTNRLLGRCGKAALPEEGAPKRSDSLPSLPCSPMSLFGSAVTVVCAR